MPKNNILNADPSTVTNRSDSDTLERADDLSTTDNEVETGDDNKTLKNEGADSGNFRKSEKDAEEKESYDNGADEEA